MQLNLSGYQGDLKDLAARIRRRALSPLAFSASELVDQLQYAWREATTFDDVADELPVAAWLVHRKGMELIGGSEPMEPDPESEIRVSAEWIPAAVEALKALTEAEGPARAGPPRWPSPAPPKLLDATPWRLVLAWPPGRPPRPAPLPQVVVPPTALWRRGLKLVHWLRRRKGQGLWKDLAKDLERDQQVEAFMVLLSLWAHHRVELKQAAPYADLMVRSRFGAEPSRKAVGDGHNG